MLRHPAVITSLEEDFKALGLLHEEEGEPGGPNIPGAHLPSPPQTPGPSGAPATNKTSKSRNVGAMTDDPDEYGKTGTDDAEGTPHQGRMQPPAGFPMMPTGGIMNMAPGGKPKNSALPPDDEDPDGEGGSQKVGGGGTEESISGMPDPIRAGKSKPKAKESPKAPPEKQEDYELYGASAVSEAVNKARGGKAPTQTESVNSRSKRAEQIENRTGTLGLVANLIEEVNGIVSSIDESHRSEGVKAFANIAIISEMLRRGFENYGNHLEDEELLGTAAALARLSEEAGDIAKALDEAPDSFDGAALDEEFRAQMDALLQGLDLYSDVVEAVQLDEGDDEKEGDEGGDEEEKDKDDDKDDDDKDDDEKKGEKEEAYFPFGKKHPLAKKG